MKKYFGDKKFYKMVLAVAIPIIIQNCVTTFVNLVDNIMIGRMGTLPMSGVSIANQLFNIFTLAMFGSVAATGIFCAQYAGRKDYQGVKNCLNLKLIISIFLSVIFIAFFLLFGRTFIASYLDPDLNSAADIEDTMNYAWLYLRIMCIGMIPFGLKESFSSTLRENGETVLPMIGSVTALITNMVLNYLLIFGKFGFPQLGVAGAAIATVTSRFVEFGLVFIIAMNHKEEYVFLNHPFKNVKISFNLVKQVIYRGAPLVANEVLWSIGLAGINQCYSTRSLTAVAAVTIVTTISQVYNTICNGIGSSISIVVGQALGTGNQQQAYETDLKMLMLTFMMSCTLGVVFFILSPLFPHLYNTTEEIKNLATILLEITACKIPVQALYMGSYFTLRCGGKTIITFLFDSVYTCAICWPVAYVLANFTGLSLVLIYLLVQLCDLFKTLIGLTLVHKGVWINTLVA